MSAAPEAGEWEAVAAALRDGSLLGPSPRGAPRCHETHISLVVVDGDTVYKLKKPVGGIYGYGTRASRKLMCERELALNRRLAPGLYLAVRGVRPQGRGFALCDAADAAAVEHVVVMRTVRREDILEAQVDGLSVQPAALDAVGRAIARFHRDAEAAPDPAGTPEQVGAWLAARVAAVRRAAGDTLDGALVTAAADFLERWLAVHAVRIADRVAQGHVRDGHGDLRLEHVVVSEPVQVLDCVEFDDALRAGDVLADLAFLVMELQLAEREDLTRILLDAWADEGGPLDDVLLWGYAASRALVRAEVALDRIAQLGPSIERKVAEERARSLVALAVRLSWRARPPRAVVFAGLPGSGKTRLSTELAGRWGLDRHSSDEVRKRLVGLGRDEAAPPGAYEDWVSREVYERLGREAGREEAAGRSVVVDATFRRASDAQAFVRAFRSAGALAQPVILACTASASTLRRRVRDRDKPGGSDAGPDVLERQLAEHGTQAPGISDAVRLATEGDPADTLADAERIVLEATVR